MYFCKRIIIICFIISSFLSSVYAGDAPAAPKGESISVKISQDVGNQIAREAVNMGEEIQSKAKSLFEHTPLGWDTQTIKFIYRWLINLPSTLPMFMKYVLDQAQLLGFLGSLIVIFFIMAILYSLFGKERVFVHIESAIVPLKKKLPDAIFSLFDQYHGSVVYTFVIISFVFIDQCIYSISGVLVPFDWSIVRIVGCSGYFS
jgi:hypothetical protein